MNNTFASFCFIGFPGVHVMNYCVPDLCCGTMSVSKALRLHYPSARIISFDVNSKCHRNIVDSNHDFRLGDVRNLDPADL